LITRAYYRVPEEEGERTHTLTHTSHPPVVQAPVRARPVEKWHPSEDRWRGWCPEPIR